MGKGTSTICGDAPLRENEVVELKEPDYSTHYGGVNTFLCRIKKLEFRNRIEATVVILDAKGEETGKVKTVEYSDLRRIDQENNKIFDSDIPPLRFKS